jgi:hypothetical protein
MESAWRFDPLVVDMEFIGFRQAILNGQHDRVRTFLAENKMDPSVLDNWAIRRVCDSGEVGLAALLLTHPRVDPAALNSCALTHAAHKGQADIVNLLLRDGRADPAADNNQAVRLAALCGHTDVLRLLIEDGRANPAANNNAALFFAAKDGLDDTVAVLLAQKSVLASEGVAHALSAALGMAHHKTASLFPDHQRALHASGTQVLSPFPDIVTAQRVVLTEGQKVALRELSAYAPGPDVKMMPAMMPSAHNRHEFTFYK